MTIENQYRQAELLKLSDLHQLAGDVAAELEDEGYPHKDIAAWFLRNKCYIPYSLVAELVGYSTAEKAARADQDLRWGCESSVVSLCGEYSDIVAKLQSLANNYYGLGSNVLMERAEDELCEALLLEASEACGYRDNRRNGQWFQPTPKDSTLRNLILILDEDVPVKHLIRNFTITNNY